MPSGTAFTVRRADAQRNRRRILDAARDLLAERGRDVPLDAVAERAGVGNATLYRHFATRPDLYRAVAIDVLTGAAAAAASAAQLAEPFAALADYFHRLLDLRVAAVMPVLAGTVGDDADVRQATSDSATAMHDLIDAAHQDGSLDPAITFGDLGLLLIRLSRPIPPFAPDINDSLAHRHLEIVLRGLRVAAGDDASSLKVVGPTLDDIHRLSRRQDRKE